jgi:hypothetical protein
MDPAMMGMPPAGAPPMDPAMAGMPPAGAPPMDPAMMGMDPAMADQLMAGAPAMDPAMAGAPPMDPAMAGMPPAGPSPEQVGAVGAEAVAPAEPTVADMPIADLQLLIADTVKATIAEAGAPVEGQVSELQDVIAGMQEDGGAIPVDSPDMPAPDASMMEGFADEVTNPAATALPEGAIPKQASESEGELLKALTRLNNLR